MHRRLFQLAGIASVVAFAAASLPFYASLTGRQLHLFGSRISAGSFGSRALLLMVALWVLAVVCLILSFAYRERGRWVSAFLLTSLLALMGVAVVVFGIH